jgi:archaemetzincin
MAKRPLQFYADRLLALALVPCGPVEHEDLNHLASALSRKGVSVTIATERPVPPEAFNSRRQQYRAEDFLDCARIVPGDRVLAVTSYDLSAGNLHFVFGIAESFGRCAVISLFRLRVGVDVGEFRRRAVKEAVHELGHTFGLCHCSNSRCVMYFSNSLVDTDRKGTDWCEMCERQLCSYREQFSLFQHKGG